VPGKKTKKSAPKKRLGVQAQAIDNCFANAQRNAQPGIIATIMQILLKAKDTKKPATVNEILDMLAKKFPDRPREHMAVTVRAQLHRLPDQKDFPIEKIRDGREMRYAAA
jgi:hypothetical protein